LQVRGPWELHTEVERFDRNARVFRLYEGTSDVRRTIAGNARNEPARHVAEDRAVRRKAVAGLGTALCELVEAAVLTEVPIEELGTLADAARDLAARLREQCRELHEVASVDDPEIGERWYSPVSGPGNPVAPPMIVEAADGRSTGRVTLGKRHEGPPGLVHGGVVAALLDQVLARAVRASGRGGALTATLMVRYDRPVPLAVPLIATAEVTGTDGRRSTASARLVAEDDPGSTLAVAEGLFVALRPDGGAGVLAATGRDVGGWTARD
jgi:uncharacterized protein (TIGR00369 family)